MITFDDLVARGVSPHDARADAETVPWMLRGGQSTLRWEAPGRENECDPTCSRQAPGSASCSTGTDGLHDPLNTRHLDGCEPGEVVLEFAVREDRLYPTVVRTVPASDLSLTKAFFERWWTRIYKVAATAVTAGG